MLEEIGKRYYDFVKEKIVYCYLSCIPLKKRDLRRIDTNLKFDFYYQWKQYIIHRYKKLNKEGLQEFSRYLNQRRRNENIQNEYFVMIKTAFWALAISKIVEVFEMLELKCSYLSYSIITLLVAFIVIETLFCYLFITDFKSIKDGNINKDFLTDFKEIIDEMIKKEDRIQNGGTRLRNE